MIIKVPNTTPILFGTDPEAAAVYIHEGKQFALPPYFFRKFLDVPFTDPVGDMRHPVFFQEDGIKLIEDGANFEMTILPSTNPRDLFDRIQECARLTSERILRNFPEHCLPDLKFIPTVDWDVERWTALAEKLGKEFLEEFSMSTQFGCDPDYDALETEAACDVEDVWTHPERYCGGHFHTSGSPRIAEDPHLAVYCMMMTTGLASTAFSKYPELEHRRLYRYGRPARFRVQNYGKDNPFGPEYAIGLEYRTPSATWAGDWDVAKEVMKWAEIGIKNLLETSLGATLAKELLEPSVKAIMTTDQALAHELLGYIESKL